MTPRGRRAAIACTWALVVGCTVPEVGSTKIIGHGGMGMAASAPMNSEASLSEAMAIGTDGVELDVHLSRDGVLVAYHAQDLAEETRCAGLINSMEWSGLRTCTVEGRDGREHPLIRPDALLPALANHHPDAAFTLDVKLFAADDWWTYLEAFSDAVAALEAIPVLKGRVVVECQVTEFLDLVRRKAPGVPVFLYTSDPAAALDQAANSGYTGITVRYDRITPDEVKTAQHKGLQVCLFGAGGRWSHRNALGKGPDRLQTDDPVALATAR
jgi:glycerophosphoryl diester phosphodiesterase